MGYFEKYRDEDSDFHCHECEESQYALREIKYWFQSVIDQLYSKSPLDLFDLENCLDEICHQLGMKLPQKILALQRAEKLHPSKVMNVKPFDIDGWKDWNKQYLKTINS